MAAKCTAFENEKPHVSCVRRTCGECGRINHNKAHTVSPVQFTEVNDKRKPKVQRKGDNEQEEKCSLIIH